MSYDLPTVLRDLKHGHLCLPDPCKIIEPNSCACAWIAQELERLGRYKRAVGLIRAKAELWPNGATPEEWFREILDVCALVEAKPGDQA